MKIFMLKMCACLIFMQSANSYLNQDQDPNRIDNLQENGAETKPFIDQPEQMFTNILPVSNNNRKLFQQHHEFSTIKSAQDLESLKNCIFKETSERLEKLLGKLLKKSNEQIYNFIQTKPQQNLKQEESIISHDNGKTINSDLNVLESPFLSKLSHPQNNNQPSTENLNRKIRQPFSGEETPENWSKCVLRSELQEHSLLENIHIASISQEIKKLQQLIRLLQDQQYILNILNDFDNKPKAEDISDQKQLIKLLQVLKNNMPQEYNWENNLIPQGKSENLNVITVEKPKIFRSKENAHHLIQTDKPIENRENITNLVNELNQLKHLVVNKSLQEVQNKNEGVKLQHELENQRNQLQDLRNRIESLKTFKLESIKDENKTNQPNLKMRQSEGENQIELIQQQLRDLENKLSEFMSKNTKNPSDNENSSNIVGASLPNQKFPQHHNPTVLEKRKPNPQNWHPTPFSRKAEDADDVENLLNLLNQEKPKPKSTTSQNSALEIERLQKEINNLTQPKNKKPNLTKPRANDEDFMENLQKLLEDSEQPNVEVKANLFDLNDNPTPDLEDRLGNLQKRMEVLKKIQKLEKKVKQLHDTDEVETKTVDEDEETVKKQLKKMMREIKKLNKDQIEGKDADDMQQEFKNLQAEINNLKPNDDDDDSSSLGKIGKGTEIQIMLNKLFQKGGTVQSKPTAQLSHGLHLSPAQIQLLKRKLIQIRGGNQFSTNSEQFGAHHGHTGVGEADLYGSGGSHYGTGYFGSPGGPYGHATGLYGIGSGPYSAGTASYGTGDGQYGYGSGEGLYGVDQYGNIGGYGSAAGGGGLAPYGGGNGKYGTHYASGSGKYGSSSGQYGASSGKYGSSSNHYANILHNILETQYGSGSGKYGAGSGKYGAGNDGGILYGTALHGPGSGGGLYGYGGVLYGTGDALYGAGSGLYGSGSALYGPGGALYGSNGGPYGPGSSSYGSGGKPYGPGGGIYGNGPYGSGGAPYGTEDIPHGPAAALYETGSGPYGFGDGPYGSGSSSYGSGSGSYGSGSGTYGSGSGSYGSGGKSYGPGGGLYGNGPYESGGALYGTEGKPHGSGDATYETKNGPYGSRSGPYGSGGVPYGSGSASYGSASASYGPGSSPYGNPYALGGALYGPGVGIYGSGDAPYGAGGKPYEPAGVPYGSGGAPYASEGGQNKLTNSQYGAGGKYGSAAKAYSSGIGTYKSGSGQYGPTSKPYGTSSGPYNKKYGSDDKQYGTGYSDITHGSDAAQYGGGTGSLQYSGGPGQYHAIPKGNNGGNQYGNSKQYKPKSKPENQYAAPIAYKNPMYAPSAPAEQQNSYNPANESPNYLASNAYPNTGAKTYKPQYAKPSINVHNIFEHLAHGYQHDPKTQFFPNYHGQGYGTGDAENYQPTTSIDASNSQQPYANAQQNPSVSESYTQQKVSDLKTQIYGLENVINNLNGPEYIQKPGDQEMKRELDQKIDDLKHMVTYLSRDTPYSNAPGSAKTDYQQPGSSYRAPGSDSDQSYNPSGTYGAGNVQKETHNDHPYSEAARKRREVPSENGNQESTSTDAIDELFQQLNDVMGVIKYLTQGLPKGNNSEGSSKATNVNFNGQPETKIDPTKRQIRQVTNDETFHDEQQDTLPGLYNKLNNLVNIVNDLTKNISKNNFTCVNNKNCLDGTNPDLNSIIEKFEKPILSVIRRKRQVQESDEDDGTEDVWSKMSSFFREMVDENSRQETDDAEEVQKDGARQNEDISSTAYVKQDLPNSPDKLHQKLQELKKQLDSKLHPTVNHQLPLYNQKATLYNQRAALYNQNAMSGLSHATPYSRSSYYGQPTYYQQPSYYPQQSYSYQQPYYYQQPSYDLEKEKTKKLKFKKKSKKSDLLDKVFTKILDKILDKIVAAVPKVTKKLLSFGFDDLLGKDFGYEQDDYNYGQNGYNQNNYGVQKDYKKLGLFSFIPMIILKLLTKLSSFVRQLQKNKFIRTFLVPALVTAGTAGMIVFLVWWLTGDDLYGYGNYGNSGYSGGSYSSGYSTGYGGGYSNSNGYRSSMNSNNENSNSKTIVDNYYDRRDLSSNNYLRGNVQDSVYNNLKQNDFTGNDNVNSNMYNNRLSKPNENSNYYNRNNYNNYYNQNKYNNRDFYS